jgi:hypothetical protein
MFPDECLQQARFPDPFRPEDQHRLACIGLLSELAQFLLTLNATQILTRRVALGGS